MALKQGTFKINDLTPGNKNPRLHDLPAIKESLTTHGQYRTIVVNEGTQTGTKWEVLAGNGTVLAAKELGWDTIDANIIDVGRVQADKILAVDNKTNDLASYDEKLLGELLTGIKDESDLVGTGFTEEELVKLLQESSGPRDTGDSEEYVAKFELVVECRDEQHQETLFRQLKEQGETCRLLSL